MIAALQVIQQLAEENFITQEEKDSLRTHPLKLNAAFAEHFRGTLGVTPGEQGANRTLADPNEAVTFVKQWITNTWRPSGRLIERTTYQSRVAERNAAITERDAAIAERDAAVAQLRTTQDQLRATQDESTQLLRATQDQLRATQDQLRATQDQLRAAQDQLYQTQGQESLIDEYGTNVAHVTKQED